jgi:hypothetical protein
MHLSAVATLPRDHYPFLLPMLPPPLPVAPSPFPSPGATTPVRAAHRDWWIWLLAAAAACLFGAFFFAVCSPFVALANLANDKALETLHEAVDSKEHPILFSAFEIFVKKYVGLATVQLHAQSLGVGVLYTVVPFVTTLVAALVSHPIFIIGGAPGGWRGTLRSFALHRFLVEIATILFVLGIFLAPLDLVQSGLLLFIAIPFVRITGLILLWIHLARTHAFGPVRALFLGPPGILFAGLFSFAFSFVLALYAFAYLIVRSF